jgi:pimeloyl-ACP methyl ester carboxylesterase
VTFGQLTIDDNVSVILQTLEALRARQLAPHVIVAHSMGGLAVQALQQKLLDRGSSLAALGVRQVLLLAPVPAPGSPWVRPPTPDLSAFVVQDAKLGPYVSLPPALFVAQAFSTTAGTVATDAPTADEVAARGYSAVEPLYTLFQLTDTPVPQADGSTNVLQRPEVAAGVFARPHGTVLWLASFSEDTLVPASNLPALYRYLTGDARETHYLPIVAPDAVHSSYISNPTAILTALRNLP